MCLLTVEACTANLLSLTRTEAAVNIHGMIVVEDRRQLLSQWRLAQLLQGSSRSLSLAVGVLTRVERPDGNKSESGSLWFYSCSHGVTLREISEIFVNEFYLFEIMNCQTPVNTAQQQCRFQIMSALFRICEANSLIFSRIHPERKYRNHISVDQHRANISC